MIIKEISKKEFDNFASNHFLKNYYQSSNYGNVMDNFGYNSIYIGGFLDDELIGASLILSKYITLNIKYGYAPRGFLIDYFNKDLFTDFTCSIRKYFNKKGFAFIKINPEIILNEIDNNSFQKRESDKAKELISYMETINYKKLKNNLYFESLLPKYNAIVNLDKFSLNNLSSKFKSKLKYLNKPGINFVKGNEYNINEFYELIKKKKNNRIEYYKKYYKEFNKYNETDLWFIQIDYNIYLKNIKAEYNVLHTDNEEINKLFLDNSNDKNIYKKKMQSDKDLISLHNEISRINELLHEGVNSQILATAFAIKYDNRVNIVISGYDKNDKLNANYILYVRLANHYKSKGYKFLDLNGITGDFSKDNPYKGLNEFKLNFIPKIYEYIGEFDLIIKNNTYSLLWTTKKLENEFNRKDILTK